MGLGGYGSMVLLREDNRSVPRDDKYLSTELEEEILTFIRCAGPQSGQLPCVDPVVFFSQL